MMLLDAAEMFSTTVLALWTARGAARDGHPLGWLLMTVAGLIALGLGVLEVIAYFVGK